MNTIEIIAKKREHKKLTPTEIKYIVQNYVAGKIPDYQVSALLMAIFLNGMDYEETFILTSEYIKSGEIIKFDNISKPLIDKHSTGGVGDKISIILAPIASACGIAVPMISGRGLGHTGGTLDKLESIPGFRVNYSPIEFKYLVEKNGFAIISQTDKLIPADKKIYALRDVTATVSSIPLITASIIAKKIAEGIDGLVVDLKLGTGAFIQTEEKAEELSKNLIHIGKDFNKKVNVVVSNMNAPLGVAIGNGLEIIESIEFLKGNLSKKDSHYTDLIELTYFLVAEMLLMGNIVNTIQSAYSMINKVIANGTALQKFKTFVQCQQGNPNVIDDYSLLGKAKYKIPITINKKGYICAIDSKEIGLAMIDIGAGRKVLDSKLDYSAGAKIWGKIGDEIEKDETIGYLFCNNAYGEKSAERIRNAFKITELPVKRQKLIKKIFKREQITNSTNS
ncbi:MAG: thymidine phosphorylase [Candidatus Cloacimonadota bacterium]|nr:MAG: thymidine phosphorylase [Candidatus Cloacimonadota bacterium]